MTTIAPVDAGHGKSASHTGTAGVDPYLALRAISEVFEDLQRTRIAIENRVRTAPVDVGPLEAALEGLARSEHETGLLMRRTYRRVDPAIVEWQKGAKGVGEHLLARLLGVIGHPVETTVHAWEGSGSERQLVVLERRRRRVSDLWSYCGYGDPTRRPRRGMSAEEAAACGNPKAKMLTYLLAEACMKQMTGDYRPVYEGARANYADRVHETECLRCGPSGKPAQPGSPWSAAHQHAAALRLVAKEILRDLWRAAGGGAA